MQRKRLGDILLENGITQEQLNRALEYQKETGERLGQAVVKLGYMSASKMANLLSEHLGVPRVNWDQVKVTQDLLSLLPDSLLRQGKVCPIELVDNTLILAMVDPYDVMLMDEVRRYTGYDVRAKLATPDEIEYAISQGQSLDVIVRRVIEELSGGQASNLEVDEQPTDTLDSTGVRIVDLMLNRAIQERASDIHVEPRERILKVRFRIDGVLRDAMDLPKAVQSDVITRIKVMAEMDITERRRPQDGRIRISVAGQPIDMRISSLPTIYGEKIVIRIFNQAAALLRLEDLNFLPSAYARVRQMLRQPQGLILVTGPTGSGKTTTLYAFLNELNEPDKNILTIEDPVEYRLEGINQVQVNPRVDLTFASGLRTMLRQDPDIIMVGEMRDTETAEIGIRAALTGHLVLSTLHTNSAVATVMRLVDMGIPPTLIATTLIGVVAQRLVRVVCPECKEEVEVTDPLERAFLGLDHHESVTVFRGRGCRACGFTGYRGRAAVEEVLLVNQDIRYLIQTNASAAELQEAAIRSGMKTLEESGKAKIRAGLTTVEEVMRIVYGLEELDRGI